MRSAPGASICGVRTRKGFRHHGVVRQRGRRGITTRRGGRATDGAAVSVRLAPGQEARNEAPPGCDRSGALLGPPQEAVTQGIGPHGKPTGDGGKGPPDRRAPSRPTAIVVDVQRRPEKEGPASRAAWTQGAGGCGLRSTAGTEPKPALRREARFKALLKSRGGSRSSGPPQRGHVPASGANMQPSEIVSRQFWQLR